jgi:hypothetical protein
MSTYKKTASTAGASIATSTTTSSGGSASGSVTTSFGSSIKSSTGKSVADKIASSSQADDNTLDETSKTSTSAFISETILMPMRSARLNYDGMRLSEDAKRAVRKLSTEREALHFLRTYGTHLPLGMITLGGAFNRTITMEASEKVTSTSLYSAAGSQMSDETSSADTSSTSAAASVGLFGLGYKGGGSKNNSTATKSGESSHKAKSVGDGNKEADTDTFYSLDVSSLGPNASTPEQFYTLLNENTGTWAVIDRGDLDEVIPIWDLIKDELLDSAKKPEEKKKSTDEGDGDLIKDKLLDNAMKPEESADEGEDEGEGIQIRRAIRLMKRVWARKARKFMSNSSAPNLPDLIVRAIEDFVAVDAAVGEMVDAICTVIKPKLIATVPHEEGSDGKRATTIEFLEEEDDGGNRLAMLKSLKEVVSAAKDAPNFSDAVYEYGNWWIERFIKQGEDHIETLQSEKKLKFRFTVEINDEELATANQKDVSRIRKAHTRAAAAAQELTDEAWEQLCDEFVPLAKCSEMRNFWSSDDYQRTAKIYNVHFRQRTEVLSIQTPISTITVDPKTSATLHCPDAITPIQVRVSPPFFYDEAWGEELKEGKKTFRQFKRIFINANQTMVYDIYPGVTYYWSRDEFDGSHMIVSEEELLARGKSVIINELPESVPLFNNADFLSIPAHTAWVVDYGDEGKLFLDGTDADPTNIGPGKKYYMYHSGHLSSVSGPQLVSAEDKRDRESRERGSIIMSASGSYRRIHEWQKTSNEQILNGVPSKFADYCLDQFWTFVPTSPPSYASDRHATYLIVNKSSKSRLFATVSTESGRDGFGFAKEGQKVEDSQKWQFELADPYSENGEYHIVNVLSDRRLGLENDGNGTTETRIVATIPEEYYALSSSFEGEDYESRHCWKPLPWETIKDIASSYNLPLPSHILSRETLPSNELLKKGGIIVENACPILVTLYWEKGGATKKYYLRPGSQVYMKRSNDEPSTKDVLSMDEPNDEQPELEGDVNIFVERNGSPAKRSVKPGKKHRIVFPAENPLFEGTPDVILLNDDGNDGADKSQHGCLIVRVPKPNIPKGQGSVWRLEIPHGRWYASASNSKWYNTSQLFDIELVGGMQYRVTTMDGRVVPKFAQVGKHGVSISDASHIIEPVVPTEEDQIPICTIQNKTTGKYLYAFEIDGEITEHTPGVPSPTGSEAGFTFQQQGIDTNLRYGTIEDADTWAIIPASMVDSDEAKEHLQNKSPITFEQVASGWLAVTGG